MRAFLDAARTCLIIGSGPSAADVDYASLARWPAIVVNDAYRLHPQADILYAHDLAWWDVHEPDTRLMKERWTASIDAWAKYGDLFYIPTRRQDGFSIEPGVLYVNHNSGAQAMQLAWQHGAKRLVLIGFDMGPLQGQAHFFGDHPQPLAKESPWSLFYWEFWLMATDCQRKGIEVINTSADSHLTVFPKQTLAAALKED